MTQVLEDGSDTYLYGLERIAQTDGAGADYFLGDALGSVRQLADESSAVTLAEGYDPFGAPSGSFGPASTRYGFAGELADPSGLTFLRARYYAPGVGRFTSRDPFSGYINLPQSQNPYAYALNNPVRYTDPSGECPWCIAGVVGLVLGAGSDLAYQLYNNGGNWGCVNWGQVALWGGAGAIAGLTMGLLAAPPEWLMMQYLLATNTPWIVATLGILGAATEFYLGVQAVRGNQDAIAALTGGWIITGESAIVGLISSLRNTEIALTFSFPSISLGGSESALERVTVSVPSIKYVGTLEIGEVGTAAGELVSYITLSGRGLGGGENAGIPRPGDVMGQGRQTGKPGKHASGIYEFFDQKAGKWYVGETDDLYTRLRGYIAQGRLADWNEVVWTEIRTSSTKALRVAERVRYEQMSEFLGGQQNMANNGNLIGRRAVIDYFNEGWPQTIPTWPNWLANPFQ